MKHINLVLFIFFFILSSCNIEKSLEGYAVNQYGGNDRANNYEKYEKFHDYNFYEDIPEDTVIVGAIALPIALSSVRVVVPTTDGHLVEIIGNQIIWSSKLPDNSIPYSNLVADSKLNLYVIGSNRKLYSYFHDGKLRMSLQISDTNTKLLLFSDLLVQNDGLIIASNDGLVKKIDFNGKVLWNKRYNLSPIRLFASTENGSIAIPISNNTFGETDSLVFIASNGKELWKKGFDSTRLINSSCIYKNNIVLNAVKYVNENKFYKVLSVDTNSKLLWEFSLNNMPKYTSIDSEGNIYVVTVNSGFGEASSSIYCLTQSGKLKWKQDYGFTISSSILVSEELLAFTTVYASETAIHFIKKDGSYKKIISLSNAPIVKLQPIVRPDGVIVFAGSEKLCLVRIDEIWINKIIPW